ncbi:MAG TPA: DUF1631 domain-containing protein [Rhodanobacteraceae bacterium]|nr:DUF1631 domain-containing protein [Rhodanobacteraceae bacterium]
MTAPNDTPKVVDLSKRQVMPGANDRLGDLLKLVRGISQKRINGLVSTLFENVDDALFDLAERAGSNALQTEFFDGMREVRKKRQLVERLFQDQAAKNFTEFAEGKLKSAKPDVAPQASGGLSLVDDQELEESLAVSSMVAKAENRLQRSLYQINQRLGVIIGGGKVEDSNNPIGPAVLGSAFRFAVKEFTVNVQVKLIVYKLFDRYVMAGLEPLYEEVNIELIRAGVLPQIRHTVPQGSRPIPAPAGPGAGPHTPQQPGIPLAGSAGTAYYDPAAAELQAELYGQLRNLLASRHHGRVATGEYTPGTPGLTPTELLSALTILQGQAPAMPRDSITDAAQAVQALKLELMEQVHKLSGEAKQHHVSSADEDTIDLVGMLFEFILQDRNLPAQIQALLGRLQIPYLKVAILDKHLFAQKTHPARRLLDALADAGKSWSEESDKDHRLQDRIRQVVETILTDFDDDVGIFDKELESFGGFMDQYHRRAEIAEQRAAEATRGREKLQDARRTAAREILSRIEERNLPPVVHAVLSRPWANYLVLTLLRQGESSDEWKSALRFADEFVWSALPKTNDLERTRLRALLPQLEKALRHGLATVAYHDNDVKQLMHELSQFYQRLLDGEKVEVKTAKEVIAAGAASAIPGAAPTPAPAVAGAPQAEAPAAPATAVPATQSPVEEIVLNSNPVETPAPEENYAEDDEFLKAAREIKVGTWLEFADAEGNRERAKLSWISPISSKYLFVNRRGLKVCDKTVFALAAELRRGSTIVLEEVPLFDRALDAIVARLRSAQAESSAGAAAGASKPAAATT